VTNISEPGIAAAYIPLHRGGAISHAEGAAMVIAPGVAVTNRHNRDLLSSDLLIGAAKDYDLLFFRDRRSAAPMTAAPMIGEAVTAYGQGADADLRQAHGVVRAIRAPDYFTFAGDAGPGFSGGPVLDASGKLIGITFGYKDEGPERLIYAYPMARVLDEYSRLPEVPKN